MKAIRIISRDDNYKYIDFEICDSNGENDGNLYRYYENDRGFKKLYGVKGNWSKAIRGNERKIIQQHIKAAYENRLPIIIIA